MKRSIRFHNVLFVLLLLAVSAALLPGTAQASMVGFWNLNEGSGTTASDFSANNNDGTLAGNGGKLPLWVAGHTGNTGDYALSFNDSNWNRNVWVKVNDSASLHIGSADNKSFTIALWVYDIGSYYAYPLYDGTTGTRNWFFQSGADTGNDAYFWSDTKTGFRTTFGAAYGLDDWHHLAVTYDGTTVRSYIDGVAKGTKSTTTSFTNWYALYIGNKAESTGQWDPFGGCIDDVVIFNSVENVTDIMNGTQAEMPEPATLSLLVLGGLAMLRRRRAA
jgi:hypothetical protein